MDDFLIPYVVLNITTTTDDLDGSGGGAGSALHPAVLISAGLATFAATVISLASIMMQLKNYRKPILQRMVIRIMIMVPLYAISSLVSLFSLNAAFTIDALRDVYEAFVIYCFFNLLIAYLGGERSLLILLYGRPPKQHPFPVSLFKHELDASDPFTFLFLKRGILQYVQIKPVLAVATLILKATGTYKEGELSWSAGYLYISFIYNVSICLSLYCLAMFWLCVNQDIKPFRPVPKFLCVKGILFFSFWQALSISALVAIGAIKQIGPYTDSEHISLAITDTLICYEMPFFALAHWFAFSHTDYIDNNLQYAARMPFTYALRDAFGFLDVIEDSRATLRGGVSYRTFEPVEGGMHQGIGRERRIHAGLRYSKGGKKKYWLPMPQETTDIHTGPIRAIQGVIEEHSRTQHGYAQLMDEQAEDVVHDDPDTMRPPSPEPLFLDEAGPRDIDDEWSMQLEFDDPEPEMEKMFEDSRKLMFGDYHYPVIDVSGEEARRRMWDEEERILSEGRAAFFSPLSPSNPKLSLLGGMNGSLRGARGIKYGATGEASSSRSASDPDPQAARRAVDRIKGGVKTMGVYGAWAENAPHPQSANHSPMEESPPLILVDGTTPEPTPDTQDGIHLGTARSTNDPSVIPRRASTTPSTSSRSSPRSKPSVPPSPLRTTPPQLHPQLQASSSRQPSSTSIHNIRPDPPSRRPSSPALPPDAIDLVVEDVEAEEEEMTRERRKGEPAVRQTGERKVYRREYIVQDPKDGKEKDVKVRVEEEEGVPTGAHGERGGEFEKTKVTVEDEEGREESEVEIERDGDGGEESSTEGRGGDVGEVLVADEIDGEGLTRAVTPPLHTRVFSPDPDDSNPWA